MSHDAFDVESIPYNVFADFPYFWSKCVCVFNSIDTNMNESELDGLWHNFKVQMTAIINLEWNNCTKLDADQQRK